MSENPLQPNTTADGRPRKARRRCVRACVGLVCLVRLCTDVPVCLAQDTPLEISEETTYITEPLTADGKQVDYFAALELKFYPENMKTDDNGYRLLVKNLGDLGDTLGNYNSYLSADREECAAQTLEKLGLEPSDIRRPALKFQEPHDFLQDYVESDEFDEALVEKLRSEDAWEEKRAEEERTEEEKAFYLAIRTPPLEVLDNKLGKSWTLDDLPMMAEWLEENGPALDLIGQAVRKPSFRVPLVRTDETRPLYGSRLFAGVHLTRSVARALSARAHHRIAMGDIDGAVDDILACKRLGRHVGRAGSTTEGLIGMAIEGIAGSIGVAASLEHQPTEAQLQRLFHEWENIPPRMDFNESLLSERYFTLDFVQGTAHGDYSLDDLLDNTPGSSDGMSGFVNAFAGDWNLVAKRMNELYDNVEKGMKIEEPNLWSPMLLFPGHRSRVFGDLLGSLLIPAIGACREASRRTECCDNLHRIALAMLIHERRHGTLPPAYTVDTEGVPLHSWRVLLLPYLGQQELYDKIRLDEPWDSEYNRQFHHQAGAFYQCPTAALDPGQTTYSVVVGPDMPFAAGEGRSRSDLGPQSENMILIVERAGPVCWMDPTQEVPQAVAEEGINLSDPVTRMPARGNGIASGHSGGAQAGRLDGSVRFYSEVIDAEVLRQLLNGTNDSRDD